MTRFVQGGALLILSGFLIIRGLLPALRNVDTDFPNYYTSARLLAHGGTMERVYDDEWFQQQIYASGIDQRGKFSPYPPVTAFVMLPLVVLQPLDALRAWTVFNIACLVAGIVMLSRVTNRPLLWSAILFLASGHALANNFRFGQFYLVLTVFVIAGFLYWQTHRQTAAGIVLGAAAAIKYFPILFVPLFIFRREWRIVFAGLGTVVFLFVAAIVFMGFSVHEQFISTILGKHLGGNIQDPFSPTFQSWNSLFRRLFVPDPVLNPSPLVHSPALLTISLVFVVLCVVILFLIGYTKANASFGASAPRYQFALLNIAGLLLLPASATYHLLLLVLPVAILLESEDWNFEQYLIAGFFVLSGFLPYTFFARFQNAGILTILAYPRLILITGLFVQTFTFISRAHRAQSDLRLVEGMQV